MGKRMWGGRAVAVLMVGVVANLASPAAACTGDCNGNEIVSIDELVRGVNTALGTASVSECAPLDQSGDGGITIDEVVGAVNAAINGCPRPVINTVVGTGIAGLNEDGLPPLESHLYLPQDITVGPDGNLYVVDWNNHRIRRVADGVVETIAGTGELGDGKDGIAIYTQFNHPTNVCFDDQGRMIIAAWHNSLVKRLDFATGYVENLAGTGARAFGGDEGPGNSARLDLPSSVAIDSIGNTIISDQANFRLRLLEPNGTIHTVCGTGVPGYGGDGGPALEAQLNAPKGQSAAPASRIDIDSRDRIYIADTGNHCIRRIDPGDHSIETIAGTPGQAGYSGDGGPATAAKLNTPSDLAVAPNGTVYIADTMNHVVRVVRPDGTIATLAGTGERGFAGDGGPADEAELDRPYGVGLAPNGTVYVADTHNQRIRKITGFSGGAVPTPRPTPPPEVIPCTDEVGSICTYVGTNQTGFTGDGKDRLATVLYWPFDIEFTSRGRRVLLDWNNHKVREIRGDDTIVTIAGTDFVGDGPADLSDLTEEGAPPLSVDLNHPTDILEASNGDLILMAWHNHKIREIDAETGRIHVLLGRSAGKTGDDLIADATLANQPPHGVFDRNGNLFFIDQRNQRIRVIYNFDQERKNAIVHTVVGDPGDPVTPGFNGDGVALETKLSFPTGGNPEPSGGLTLDASGVLYFSDTNNHRIRKVVFTNATFTEGQVTTVAGTVGDDGQPVSGDSGDGGPATEAKLNFPQDLEIGPDGNLYFADTNNHRVRRVDLTTNIIDTVAGTGVKGYSGDGGPAAAAKLSRPFGVAFDANGDLYISDTFNSRIRKVKLTE